MSEPPEMLQRLIRFTADCLTEPALGLGSSGELLHANPAACHLLGRSLDQLIPGTVWDLDPLLSGDRAQRALAEARENGQTVFESAYPRADGSHHTTRVMLRRFELESCEVLLAVLRELGNRPTVAEASSEQRFRELFEHLPIGLYQATPRGRLLEVNAALVELLGYPDRESLIALNALGLYVDIAERWSVTRQLEEQGVCRNQEVRLRRRDGSVVWVRLSVRVAQHPETGQILYEGSAEDITGWKQAREELEQSEKRFRSLVQNASDMVSLIDAQGKVIYESPAHVRVLGYRLEDRLGHSVLELIHPEDRPRILEALRQVREQPSSVLKAEYRYRHRDGSWRHLESIGSNLLDDGAVRAIVVNSRDVTDRKQAEERLRYQALHDALTGLPNRTLFLDRLETAVRRFHRHPSRLFAVLFLDLDRFKIVNDSLGHTVGDQLLVEVACLLSANLKETDSIARVGGDEFLILLEEVRDEAQANHVADRLQEAMREPLKLGGHEVFSTLSIGISMARKDIDSPEDFLREADTALHRAKSLGGGNHVVFNRSMHQLAIDRLHLQTELHRAVEKSEIFVVYQPIFQLETQAIVGLEALMRWRHPSRGLLKPGQFLEFADETGLSRALDHLVLERSCRQLEHWQRHGMAPRALELCINISQKTLSHADMVEHLERLLAELQLDPTRLTLEITEGTLFENAAIGLRALTRLKELSVRLSLDDFGTGFSSLSYLHQLPIDTLKIDRSFIAQIHENRAIPPIVLAIVQLCRSLGLKVVAEGIENGHQLRALRELGCDQGQGYYLSPPVAPEMIEALLAG